MLSEATWAQDIDPLHTTYVSYSPEVNGMPLAQVFRHIQKKTGLLFVYQPGLVDVYKSTTVPVNLRMTVAAALDSALRDTYLDFTESNRNIIVFKKPLLIKLHGRVLDADTKLPLPFATVSVKNSERGTMTDTAGVFKLGVLSDDVIMGSFVGMQSKEVKIGESGATNSELEMDILLTPVQLRPVEINAGYYKISDRESTGNIVTISDKQLMRQPITNALQGLQGTSPGIYVEQLSGLAGSGFKVRIRGQNFLRNNGSDPLYLVDGIPFPARTLSSILTAGQIIPESSGMNAISPAMIESISVLKDADATAIYGSRGANGVVLVTTKRAFDAGFKASLAVNTGISEVANTIDLLDSRQWVIMRTEAFRNDGIEPDAVNAPDLKKWDTTRDTDWQRELIGKAATFTDATVTVSSGTHDLRFLGAYNLNKQSTVFPGSYGYTRGAALANVQFMPRSNKITVTASLNYSTELNELPPIDLTARAISLSPVAPNPYNSEGGLNWEDGQWDNPYAILLNSFTADSKNLLAGAMVTGEIATGLTAKLNAGYADMSRQEVNLRRISSQNPYFSPKPITGTNSTAILSNKVWVLEPQLEYKRSSHRSKSKYEALVGLTFQRSSQKGFTLFGYGYTSDATVGSISAAPFSKLYEPGDSRYAYSACFGRINYNYAGKYLLNLTARRDASSRFAPGKIANFGAVGAAWIFSKENFIRGLDFFEFGKIRVSYGTSGNDQIDDYSYLSAYSHMDFTYNGQNAITPVQIGNTNYSWEVSRKFEAALQTGFFQNRIFLDVAYYRNISTQQLLGRKLPATTGFESVQYNLPVTSLNAGIELSLRLMPSIHSDIRWVFSANLTLPKSKLLRYDGLASSPDVWYYAIGAPTDVRMRYQYQGVDPATGEFRYADTNLDQTLNAADLRPSKSYGPQWYGGIENVITYKAIQLSFLLQYVNQTRESITRVFMPPGSLASNQPSLVMGRWQKPGDESEYHKFSQSAIGTQGYEFGRSYGDNGFKDASYLRIKNVELSFSLPQKWTQKVSLRTACVYLRGQNLLTFTNYFGLDPENASISALPPLRTISCGVQLTL